MAIDSSDAQIADGSIKLTNSNRYIEVILMTTPEKIEPLIQELKTLEKPGVELLYPSQGRLTFCVEKGVWDSIMLANKIYSFLTSQGLKIAFNPDDYKTPETIMITT